MNQCLSRNLLTSDITVKREKEEEEKVSQNMSFLASVKVLTNMSDYILSCSSDTIDKSEHHADKKHSLQLFYRELFVFAVLTDTADLI